MKPSRKTANKSVLSTYKASNLITLRLLSSCLQSRCKGLKNYEGKRFTFADVFALCNTTVKKRRPIHRMKSGVHHLSYVLFLSLAMSLFHSVFPGSLNEISH